jgi:hypothetical protein
MAFDQESQGKSETILDVIFVRVKSDSSGRMADAKPLRTVGFVGREMPEKSSGSICDLSDELNVTIHFLSLRMLHLFHSGPRPVVGVRAHLSDYNQKRLTGLGNLDMAKGSSTQLWHRTLKVSRQTTPRRTIPHLQAR